MYQVDPFLQLIGDSKLQAVKPVVDKPVVDHVRAVYGSNEDNEDALKFLSAIERTENQSKESIATMIVKFFVRSSDVTFIFIILLQCCSLASSRTTILTFEILFQEDSSGIKQQLLKEFTPVDGCPLGAQLFTESCHRVTTFSSFSFFSL